MNEVVEAEASSPASHCIPLKLTWGSLKHSFLVPSSIYGHARYLIDNFVSSIPERDEQAYATIEQLAVGWLAHIAQEAKRPSVDFTATREVLTQFFRQVETDLLRGDDIHTCAANLPNRQQASSIFLKDYFEAVTALGLPERHRGSNLLRDARDGRAKVYAIFGGQGILEDYFKELEDVYSTYRPLIVELIVPMANHLDTLACLPTAGKLFPKGLRVVEWLNKVEERPDRTYMLDTSVSVPLIGLLQLANYMVTCRLLGMQPGQLRDSFQGLAGHSQGIVTAVVVSQSDSWESFHQGAKEALTLLFWIGVRSRQVFPQGTHQSSIISMSSDGGAPSPMLSVRRLPQDVLESRVASINLHLPPDKRLQICLFNGADNYVVCGPPAALRGLTTQLGKIKASPHMDQARIRFRERKLNFQTKYLPVTAPFHSPYLVPACELIMEDICGLSFARDDLKIPVYSTEDGRDLKNWDETNLGPELTRLIMVKSLHWKSATAFEGASHVIDFGPGGAGGAGLLTQPIKDGRGVRIISATALSESGESSLIGGKEELFSRTVEHPVIYASHWLSEYGPRVIAAKNGTNYLETKFSKLFGLPPLMVAGMTPCTTHWDFVAATMNAGYHIEMAGGGYFNARDFSANIKKVAKNIAPGRGITLNLIYVNPAGIAWQIPMIRQLKAEGIAIDGLTIGAGVPSLEIATEYIEGLGLRHISLKPGSIEAIYNVIEIARSNPEFPVILQWTGGRGGGHHSFEDFHQPIIQTYSKIRDCPNIILVGGSGFGGAEDTLPYLTGTWSLGFDLAPMPFDGILFGSRMMVAKESHTSRKAKQLIVSAKGVEDTEWESTDTKISGGVISVLSEMREQIHMLATRGVRFWAEMDDLIFSLSPSERAAVLQSNRKEIIQRLNDDFQKVWFGKSKEGKLVDIDEMTYSEVLDRLVELLYVDSQSRWIDASYKDLVAAIIQRTQERFSTESMQPLVSNPANITDPKWLVAKTVNMFPRCSQQLMSAADAKFFIILCKRRGQKPIPFVPALDENFEYWFKKDSLWQSEDVDAVMDQDVDRTCILQGPVAVKYSTVVDEPIKAILDDICDAHLQQVALKIDRQADNNPLHGNVDLTESDTGFDKNHSSQTIEIHRISSSTNKALPSREAWLDTLGGDKDSWRKALFGAKTVTQGLRIIDNPLRKLFAPSWNTEITIEHPDEPGKTIIKLRDQTDGKSAMQTIRLRTTNENEIELTIIYHLNVLHEPVALNLRFAYRPEVRYAPIQEIMDQKNERVKDFYWNMWFGREKRLSSGLPLEGEFDGGYFTVIKDEVADFLHAVDGTDQQGLGDGNEPRAVVPMDFAVKVAWKAIMMPLFVVEGNLLDLVHLSNGFRMVDTAQPLRVGDVLRSISCISAVRKTDSGKTVEVFVTIFRHGEPSMNVKSCFHYRGKPDDDGETFERQPEVWLLQIESMQDVAVLRSKAWLHLFKSDVEIIDRTLLFQYHVETRQTGKPLYTCRKIQGKVYLRDPTSRGNSEVGEIILADEFDSPVANDPVTEFLKRHGFPLEQAQLFESAIPLITESKGFAIQMPASNENYSMGSGDFNPIHTCRALSVLAALPGMITHGMYLSSRVRRLVQSWAAQDDEKLFRSFDCSFDDMVLPNEHIQVTCFHAGMISGRKIIKVEASRVDGCKVFTATAEVEQPNTAYIIPGQGSQTQGMGMELYAQNPVARAIWDRADSFLHETFGTYKIRLLSHNERLIKSIAFSILHIVRHNPKVLKIHFGGSRGRRIRQNYLRMMVEKPGVDGSTTSHKVLEDIDESTVCYSFSFPQGLLYSTEFAQPALMINTQATYAVMRAKGLIQGNCMYAGHSLGEYAALGAFAEVISLEELVSVTFYRGLTMQSCVQRDEQRRTKYSMCAFNPRKIIEGFDEPALRQVVEAIQQETGWLLEIVNFNIMDMQYICAGDLRALDTLIAITKHSSALDANEPFMTLASRPLIKKYANMAQSKPQPVDLERTKAAIPLQGIDVPFHSTLLRSGVGSFRTAIKDAIKEEDVDVQRLVQRYIPNVTGKPFEITKQYIQEAARQTGSPELRRILQDSFDRTFFTECHFAGAEADRLL
ncbi:MAG: hypothetical protein Q9213_001624 [Squamulea squamosa]